MAGTARAAVTAQALEKRACQIDATSGCAVSFRGPGGIPEKCSVGDETDLLSIYRSNGHQRGDGQKTSAENVESVSASELETFDEKMRQATGKARPLGWESLHRNTPYGAKGANCFLFSRESGTDLFAKLRK